MNDLDVGLYELPAAACSTLNDPGVRLVLHCIRFSHYCERARWTLRLLGVPCEEVNYLTLLHMPGILKLQRQFKQGPGRPTASSKSPAATPCLALYDATGQHICLLQDSALICRYAVLRASALGLPHASHLYGPGLKLSDPGSAGSRAGRVEVAGGDRMIQELEQRLGGTMGIETRRLAYFYLLPLPSAGGALFINNSNNNKPLTWLVYYMCRLLLPRLLRINASTAARGRQKLLAEFDYLDGLIIQQQQQQAGAGQACDTASATADGGSGAPRLPFYLTGSKMTVADIQLACLAAPLMGIPNELCSTWLPPLDTMPQDLRHFIQGLQQRPTGKFVLDMWRVHGPAARAAGGARSRF